MTRLVREFRKKNHKNKLKRFYLYRKLIKALAGGRKVISIYEMGINYLSRPIFHYAPKGQVWKHDTAKTSIPNISCIFANSQHSLVQKEEEL